MLIAFLFVRPRLTTVGRIAVVTALVLEVVAVIYDTASAFVVLNRAFVPSTRRTIDGVTVGPPTFGR